MKQILIFIILISSLNSYSQDDCGEILSGLYDYSNRSFDSEFWRRYINEIDEKKFNSLERFKDHNTSLGISIPIKKLPVDFKFGKSGSVYANGKSYSSFSQFISDNTEISQSFKEEFRTVNSATVEAWVSCKSNKKFITWVTRNGNLLQLHMKRGVHTEEPKELKLENLQFNAENMEIQGRQDYVFFEMIPWGETKGYKGMTIGSSPKTLSFKIKNLELPSFVTIETNHNEFTAHHDIRAIVPEKEIPIVVEEKAPDRYVVSLNGNKYFTRAYWAGGAKYHDIYCNSPVPENMELIVLETSNKRVGSRIYSECPVGAPYCDSHNEFCVQYYFKNACLVNKEWYNWYKEFCDKNGIPFNNYSLCQQ